MNKVTFSLALLCFFALASCQFLPVLPVGGPSFTQPVLPAIDPLLNPVPGFGPQGPHQQNDEGDFWAEDLLDEELEVETEVYVFEEYGVKVTDINWELPEDSDNPELEGDIIIVEPLQSNNQGHKGK